MSAFQTDALHSVALPSSTLGRRRPPPPTSSAFDTDNATAGPSSDPDAASREKFHSDWNIRIDKEVKSLAGGLREIVDLADIGPNPPSHSSAPNALHLKLRTSQLIRSAQSLRDMAHELRLMLLLSDEVDMARRRDGEVKVVREELGIRRERVDKEVRGLMSGENGVRIPKERQHGEQVRAVSPDSDEEEEMVEPREREGRIPAPDTGGGGPAQPGEDDEDDFEEV